jgi:hypothetical protein
MELVLEEYETVNPGIFDHKPIDVSVKVYTDSAAEMADGSISIVAQVLKK